MTQPEICINVVRPSTEVKILSKTDNGALIRDLADRGLSAVVTNLDTFSGGGLAFLPRISGENVTFEPARVDTSGLKVMYNRMVYPHKRPEVAHIKKLNDNRLKEYADSKYLLYQELLKAYQVTTEIIHMDTANADEVESVLEVFASTPNITVKADKGNGGGSTAHMPLSELAAYVDVKMKEDKTPNLVVQPTINFGPLPAGIRAHSEEDQELVDATRSQGLLNEVRMMAVMSGERLTLVPVLRVVVKSGEVMGDASDRYIDVELPDEMVVKLEAITTEVVRGAAENAGNIQHLVAAVDYYFDNDGEPFIMEANMRSPAVPRTHTTPKSGRLLHTAIADTMYDMVQQKD